MGFIRVPNEYIYEKGINEQFMVTYGTDGFTIWCYIKWLQAHRDGITLNLKQIMEFLNTVSDGLPTVKDKRTLVTRLELFMRNKVIEVYVDGIQVDNLKGLSISKNATLYINNNYRSENFERIDEKIFENRYNKCGHIAWSLYCTICKFYNEDWGYANPSIERLSEILGYSDKPIHQATKVLEELNLIEVKRSKPEYTGEVGKNGEPKFKQEPNQYKIL